MDKETGKEVLVNGKPVTSESTFRTETAEGHFDIPFTFDATGLEGHDVVVFEKLYVTHKDGEKETDVEIASHEDLTAESQTIKLVGVPEEPKEPEKPEEPGTPDIAPPVKTGDDTPILLYIGIAAAALLLAGVSGFLYWRRKNQ